MASESSNAETAEPMAVEMDTEGSLDSKSAFAPSAPEPLAAAVSTTTVAATALPSSAVSVISGRKARIAKQMRKYKILKKALRGLVYEQEFLRRALAKEKERIWRLSQRKSVLLDQLLKYEDLSTSESDSDLASSDENEVSTSKVLPPNSVASLVAPQGKKGGRAAKPASEL